MVPGPDPVVHGGLPRLLRSVNALLPRDIAVLKVEPAPAEFHARFAARSKRYRYRIYIGPVAPPFVRPYVWHVRYPLDVARMRREAGALTGRHDFRALARAGSWRGNSVRRVLSVSVRRRGQEVVTEIEGTGFLHTMVRSFVGTLVDVGRGRLPAGTLRALLRSKRRAFAGAVAPASGLCLVDVCYRVAPRRLTTTAPRARSRA